jgi:lipopolysaccharide/colanic/teichoic acid biosynthesis glycosyltransferase
VSRPASPVGRRSTGLRGKTSLADRVEWDNYYIENWSLWLDLKIALMTALAVVRSSPQVE